MNGAAQSMDGVGALAMGIGGRCIGGTIALG